MVCLFVWNQIAQQLAMAQPLLLSVKSTNPALWLSVDKTQILRLESWHFSPTPALSYNPELLRDPETAWSETHLSVTPGRGVGYCSMTTWTKSAKYWISGNPGILSGYKWCTNPAGIREIRRLQWIWWENPEDTFVHKVYLFLHIIVNSLLFLSSYCSRH